MMIVEREKLGGDEIYAIAGFINCTCMFSAHCIFLSSHEKKKERY